MGEWRNGGKNGEGKGWRGEEEMEGWMEGLREGWRDRGRDGVDEEMKGGRVGRLNEGLDGQTDAGSGSLLSRAWQAGDPGADPAADPANPNSHLRLCDSPWGTAVTPDPAPAPRGAAGTQDKPLCPHAGGNPLPKSGTETCWGLSHHCPPSPSTPSLDPASPLPPKLGGAAQQAHLTPSPVPSPGTAPSEQQGQLQPWGG